MKSVLFMSLLVWQWFLGFALVSVTAYVAVAQAEDAPVPSSNSDSATAAEQPQLRIVEGVTPRFDILVQELLNSTPAEQPQQRPWRLNGSGSAAMAVPSTGAAARGPSTTMPMAGGTNRLPLLHLTPHLSPQLTAHPTATPLMQQALKGANPEAVDSVRATLAAQAFAKSNQSNPSETTNATSDKASPLPETPTAAVSMAVSPEKSLTQSLPQSLLVPILKVPAWLWASLGAVFIGFTLLATSGTLWLLQRIWQQRSSFKKPMTAEAPPNTPAQPEGEEAETTDIQGESQHMLNHALKKSAYVTAPPARRVIEIRQLLKPTPDTVSGVLSQWVAQVSQARQ